MVLCTRLAASPFTRTPDGASYNRLDAWHGEARAEARMTVLHDGAATGEV